MVKKIIFLAVALVPLIISAQSTELCVYNNNGLLPYHSGSTSMDFSEEDPLVVKAYFIIEEVTEIEEGINETTYLEAVAYLNKNYNQFNIFFKYIGFEYVDDALDHNNYDYFNDRINFRILPEEGGAAAGIPYPLNILITFQAFTNDEDKKFLIAHEAGHILGLQHTNGNTGRTPNNFDIPLTCNGNIINVGNFPLLTSQPNYIHENVVRDPNDPGYNATIAGDFVADTPATYREVNLCINNDSGFPVLEYVYSDEIVDSEGMPYENIAVNNFMVSDNRIEFYGFNDEFTNGQGWLMRETISTKPILQPIRTTTSSLYEPYSGNYYFAGPVHPNDKPLFQPGFDYKFVSAGGQSPDGYQVYNVPSDYEDISFAYDASVVLNEVDRDELDLDRITHPNDSAIIIEQLESQPRKCYHNRNRSPIGGKVIKFRDAIPNEHYTVTDQDSTSINNPALIQDLDSGLYIIRKEYNNGSHEQETLLKTGNQ